MEQSDIILTQENINMLKQYNCVNCNFYTDNKRDYNRHLLTNKHKISIGACEASPKILKCDKCEKVFKYSSSLSRHKKNCKHQSKNSLLIQSIKDKYINDELIKIINENNSNLINNENILEKIKNKSILIIL